MRYELTIDAEYVSNWDAAAGIREMMQNGRDAEIEHQAPLKVTHRGTTLRIENTGTSMARDVLLLGRSSKRDRADLIGKWGEGLKLGALALVRNGHPIKIRSGAEVWTPIIETSDKFAGRSVLVFNVEGGREFKNRVRVEIENVSIEDWQALHDHFLFLADPGERVVTESGSLLCGAAYRGRVYVKGILVQTDPRLRFGYDLADATLDRDRRLLDDYDLESRMRLIWNKALNLRPDIVLDFLKLLEDQAKDVEGVRTWNTSELPEAATAYVAEQFTARHGEGVIPVENFAESHDVEHLGVRGIVVPKPLAAVLARTLGDLAALREKLKEEVKARFSWGDLDDVEKRNLTESIGLVLTAEPIGLDAVDIVAFRSANLEGQFKDGRILIARRLLADRSATLTVLVHEVAHRLGGDGDKGHVAAIEAIWGKIVEELRSRP